MTYSYAHAREIFGKASKRLRSHIGTPQERLWYAGKELAVLRDSELPPEMLSDFKALYAAFNTEKAIGDEGTIAATIAKLSPQEAEALKKRVVDMATKIRGEY